MTWWASPACLFLHNRDMEGKKKNMHNDGREREPPRPPRPSHRRTHALAFGVGRHITWNCKDFNHHHRRNINWACLPSISRSPISRIMDALVYYECHFHISENGIVDGMSAEIKICHYKQWESQPAHFNTLKSHARCKCDPFIFRAQ